MRVLTFISFLIFTSISIAQLDLKIETDKQSYEYGESIIIKCSIKNESDTTRYVWSPCTSSSQAEFEFNNYYSYDWTFCLTAMERITFEPFETRSYQWIIEPEVYGLPNLDQVQKLVGHFFYRDTMDGDEIELLDTLNIMAPQYLGGQVNVSFFDSLLQSVESIRALLNAEVLSSSPSFDGKTDELWQIEGIQIDSVVNEYQNDDTFIYFEYNRWISYSSITTSVEDLELESIPQEYSLLQNYPNPFNPTTKISYSIPSQCYVSLKVFDVLGREIVTLINNEQPTGNYSIEFDASSLTSGIYFYRIQAGQFVESKKMVLMK